MKKIAKPICEDNNRQSSEDEIMKIAKSPDFQMSVAELIKEMP